MSVIVYDPDQHNYYVLGMYFCDSKDTLMQGCIVEDGFFRDFALLRNVIDRPTSAAKHVIDDLVAEIKSSDNLEDLKKKLCINPLYKGYDDTLNGVLDGTVPVDRDFLLRVCGSLMVYARPGEYIFADKTRIHKELYSKPYVRQDLSTWLGWDTLDYERCDVVAKDVCYGDELKVIEKDHTRRMFEKQVEYEYV